MRTRWFFKKEDLEGIRGSLVVEGVANGGRRDDVLATMSSQELVLTDQLDDNVITAIIGKTRVVKRKPGDQSFTPNGSFICRYNLKFIGDSRAVKLFPFIDETSDFSVSNTTIVSSDPTTNDDGRNDNNHAASLSPAKLSMSPRRVGSAEGASYVGKIRIGDNYQADIPAQLDLQRKVSFRGLANPPSQRIPTLVWDPTTDEGDPVDEWNHVDIFVKGAYLFLVNHLRTIGLVPFHDANYIGSLDNKAEANMPREIDVGSLLTELHECRGDACKAMKRIKCYPEQYMTVWNKNDTKRFDASYRIYRDSIRMIASNLGDIKNGKEVVDYQYRFKYCENFRRFLRKKREKAEEIMATVEDRMLLEKMKDVEKNSHEDNNDVDSSNSDDGGEVHAASNDGMVKSSMLTAVPATRIGPVNNRIRTWFRTGGGGKDAVGATQQRRNSACVILQQVRATVGDDAYYLLAKSIKACCTSSHAADSLLLDVKSTAEDLMKSYPDLLEQFLTFLPMEIRCN